MKITQKHKDSIALKVRSYLLHDTWLPAKIKDLELLVQDEVLMAYEEGFTNAQSLELKAKQRVCLHKNRTKYYGKYNAEICSDCNVLLK